LKSALAPRTPLDVANSALAVIALLVWIAVLVVRRRTRHRV